MWHPGDRMFVATPHVAAESPALDFQAEDSETGGSKRPTQTTLRAVHPEHGEVGFLRYLQPRRKADGILVDRLEVPEDHRGNGYGSALMDEMQRRHPNTKIDHGDRTDDGRAWWTAYSKGKSVRRGRTMAALALPGEQFEGDDGPPPCSYCGHPQFKDLPSNGRASRAQCAQCGGVMYSNGGQWQPELIGDPSNHPSDQPDPNSGGVGGAASSSVMMDRQMRTQDDAEHTAALMKHAETFCPRCGDDMDDADPSVCYGCGYAMPHPERHPELYSEATFSTWHMAAVPAEPCATCGGHGHNMEWESDPDSEDQDAVHQVKHECPDCEGAGMWPAMSDEEEWHASKSNVEKNPQSSHAQRDFHATWNKLAGEHNQQTEHPDGVRKADCPEWCGKPTPEEKAKQDERLRRNPPPGHEASFDVWMQREGNVSDDPDAMSSRFISRGLHAASYDSYGEYDGHDDDENEERTSKEWDERHPYIEEMHRGMGVMLPDKLHHFVHDRSKPVAARADALLDHVSRGGGSDERSGMGIHWTDDENVAHDFARRDADWQAGEDKKRRRENGDFSWGHEPDDHEIPHGKPATHVILHSAQPPRESINHNFDPNGDGSGAIYNYDESGESEIPIHENASLPIKGITFKQHKTFDDETPKDWDDEGEHHEFAEHQHRVASLPAWHEAALNDDIPWCAHLYHGHCTYPGDKLPNGQVLGIPQDRGPCPWQHSAFQQAACPISDPGPMAIMTVTAAHETDPNMDSFGLDTIHGNEDYGTLHDKLHQHYKIIDHVRAQDDAHEDDIAAAHAIERHHRRRPYIPNIEDFTHGVATPHDHATVAATMAINHRANRRELDHPSVAFDTIPADESNPHSMTLADYHPFERHIRIDPQAIAREDTSPSDKSWFSDSGDASVLQRTTTHEQGHHYEMTMNPRSRAKMIRDIATAIPGATPFNHKYAYLHLAQGWHEQNLPHIVNHVGTYAGKTFHELATELYTSHRHSPNPSPAAQAAGRHMEGRHDDDEYEHSRFAGDLGEARARGTQPGAGQGYREGHLAVGEVQADESLSVYGAQGERHPGPYYHGTGVGGLTHILPSSQTGVGGTYPEASSNHAYATPDLHDAWDYAMEHGGGIPKVYEVHPLGGVEDMEQDPPYDERGPRLTKPHDMRASQGFRVVREMSPPSHIKDYIDASVVDGKYDPYHTTKNITRDGGLVVVASDDDTDYRMQHQAPDGEGYGAPFHDLTSNGMFPADVYTHPHYYDTGHEDFGSVHSQVRRAQGNPDAKVTIYRALPAEHAHKGFNTGDWVSTSKAYARDHGRMNDAKDDWPVIRTTVAAHHIHTEGDLMEWGYNGPAKDGMVAYKGGHNQEIAHRADGSIAQVKRRPNPLKGYSFSHHVVDANTDNPSHHVEAFGPDENYAGHHVMDAQGNVEHHIEPEHEHVADPLRERMIKEINKRMASLQAQAEEIQRVASLDREGSWHLTATWQEVRDKAKAIRAGGGVRIAVASPDSVGGEVRGDHNIYETILTTIPGTYKVASWQCGCKWAAYAWGRSPAYKRFEGRMCSHALAMQYEAQARGMFGKNVTEDQQRPKWLKSHSPVVVQYERPTDRSPGRDLTRRAVPPGNMRSTFSSIHDDDNHYLRFGKWPEDERSFSGMNGYREEGVSTYDLHRGHPVVPGDEIGYGEHGNDTHEELQGRINNWRRGRHPAYIVRGKMVGIGDDGEPLLQNVKRVHTLDPDEHELHPVWRKNIEREDPHWEGYGKLGSYRYQQTVQGPEGYRDEDREIEGPLYHGGRGNLQPDDQLVPGRKTNSWGDEGTKSTHVYFSTDKDTALSYTHKIGPRGRLYEVEPTGDFKKDYAPHDYKTQHPLRVVRQVPSEEWPEWAHKEAGMSADPVTAIEALKSLGMSHANAQHIVRETMSGRSWFHGTPVEHVQDIKENGIRASTSPWDLRLTDSPQQAAVYARPGGKVLEYHVPAGHPALGEEFEHNLFGQNARAVSLNQPLTAEHLVAEHDVPSHTASKKCPECGASISGSVHTCPECGAHLDDAPEMHMASGEKGLNHTRDTRSTQKTPEWGLGATKACPQCNTQGCGHCGGTGFVVEDGGVSGSAIPDQNDAAGDLMSEDGIAFGDAAAPFGTTASSQKWFHGSPEHIPVGQYVESGHEPNYDVSSPQHVYLARTPEEARQWGQDAHDMRGTEGPVYVHEVEPETAPVHHWHDETDEGGDGGFDEFLTNRAKVTRVHKFGSTSEEPSHDGPSVSGVALKAADTGRVLMLQRGLDPTHCPHCGMPVEHDPSNGWQHADGSISHDDGSVVSDHLPDAPDPAAGRWEFPGGHNEAEDPTSLHSGIREWEEEIGQPFPTGGTVHHVWTSPNGVYQGHVVVIPHERDVAMHAGRVVPNPDDPKGDRAEQAAWWEVGHAKKNPALRPEVKSGTPWKQLENAGVRKSAALDSDGPLEEVAKHGYNTDGWDHWQKGGCYSYALGLTRMKPDLHFGTLYSQHHSDGQEFDEPTHHFAHDDTHAYDSAGKHSLPYLGITDRADGAWYHDNPDDYEDPSEHDEDEIRAAQDHAQRHGILEGRYGPRHSRESTWSASEAAAPEYSVHQDEQGPTFEAHVNGKNVGYLTTHDKGDHVFLDGLYVHPDHRGSGLGRNLMQRAIDHHQGRNLMLKPEPYQEEGESTPGVSADALRGFYQGMGFQPAGEYMTKSAAWEKPGDVMQHNIRHSNALSDDGRGWAEHTGQSGDDKRRARIQQMRDQRAQRQRPSGSSQQSAWDMLRPQPDTWKPEPVVHKPERIDDHNYSLNQVSKHYGWEGFDGYELQGLVHHPEHAQFSLEHVPVHSLRQMDGHGGTRPIIGYHELADHDEDEQERLHGLEQGYQSGEGIPPIVVARHGDEHIIADGSHRAAIHAANGESHIRAFVTPATALGQHEGSLHESIWSANDPLAGLEESSPTTRPLHSDSENPASTGFMTAQDPTSWDDNEGQRADSNPMGNFQANLGMSVVMERPVASQPMTLGAVLGEWGQGQMPVVFDRSGTLHEPAEPALPFTDGTNDGVDPASGYSNNPFDPYYGDSNDSGTSSIADTEDEVTPNSVTALRLPAGEQTAVADIVANFQATAAAGSLMSNSGPSTDGFDIAAAAKQHLQKSALKDFNFAEQQALINEGARGERARNVDALNIQGTHYEALARTLDAEDMDDQSLFV